MCSGTVLELRRRRVRRTVLRIQVGVTHPQLQVLAGAVAAVELDAPEAVLLEVLGDAAQAPLDEVLRIDLVQHDLDGRAAIEQILLQCKLEVVGGLGHQLRITSVDLVQVAQRREADPASHTSRAGGCCR